MNRSNHQTQAAKGHSKLLLFLISSMCCIGSAIIAEQCYVAWRDGFGAGDIRAFIFWLVQLSVVVGIIAIALGAQQCRPWLRQTLSLIIGLSGGYLWTWFVAFALGPWFGAFSFPVLYFWTFGAVVGLVFGGLYVNLYNGQQKSKTLPTTTV